ALSRTPILDHGVVMARTPLTGLDLSYHTDGLPDRNSYLTVASTCLSEALPGDLQAWGSVDLVNPSVKGWFSEANAYRMPDVVDAVITEHPVVAHQLTHPDSEPVLRVSDCVSDRVFRSSRVYRELFVPVGARYQLTIATGGNDTVTSGWIIKRSSPAAPADPPGHHLLALPDTPDSQCAHRRSTETRAPHHPRAGHPHPHRGRVERPINRTTQPDQRPHGSQTPRKSLREIAMS
ncbi:MAG: hypothetical protein ABIZ05_14545, partial [Pseudonocardiaceae bacterium]